MTAFIEGENRQTTYINSIQVRHEVNRQVNASQPKANKTDGAYVDKAGPTTTLQGFIRVLHLNLKRIFEWD